MSCAAARDLNFIRGLVGNVTAEQIRHVDCAVTGVLGVFMPVTGHCEYAISEDHTHPAYLFTITFDTYCRVRIGGSIQNSTPGTVFMIPPGVIHHEQPSETVTRYLAVMINEAYFDEQLAMYGRSIPADLCGTPIRVTDRLVTTVKEFLDEYEEEMPGYEHMLAASAQTITHLLIRLLLDLSPENKKTSSRMSINDAIEYIHVHYGAKITMNDLARVAGLSPSHFTRTFKKETGFSPSDYIVKTRLDMAKRMLRAGDKPITTIALDCGFNSSAYFSQCFMRMFKSSPSDFKKSTLTA